MTNRRNFIKTGALAAATALGAVSNRLTAQSRPGARFRIALGGDYESIAASAAPWDTLGDDVDVVSFNRPFNTTRETVEAFKDFDVLVLMRERILLPREALENLPRLKLIVFSGHMNAALDHQAAADHNIIVCNALGFGGDDEDQDAVRAGGPAELTLALMLACAWHIPAADRLVRQGGWLMQPETPLKIPLGGKVLGIVGYGSIGATVGEYVKPFGMEVHGFSRSLTDEIAQEKGIVRSDLESLMRNADVVSIHLPLTAATTGMIGARELGWMKPGAMLINTARAPIIEEQPLIEALRSRRIAMAGFDVFYEEPLPRDHEFIRLPNVVMTPHIGWVSESGLVNRYKALFDVVAAFRQGRVENRYTPGPRDVGG